MNNPKPAEPGPAIYGDNHGIAAKEVHIGTVKIGRQGKGKRATTPGLIEADPDMRTYASYLVKRNGAALAHRLADGARHPRLFLGHPDKSTPSVRPLF